MSSHLNPALHDALNNVLGKVRVSNEGCRARIAYTPEWSRRGPRLLAKVEEWGETYRVNCPECGDTRGRLSVCHLFGTFDRKTGGDFLHTAHCHNESCFSTRPAQERLWGELVVGRRQPAWTIAETTSASVPAPPPCLPAGLPLVELPAGHPAVEYLRGRGFDPAAIARERDLRYADNDPACRPAIRSPRLVIPVRQLPLPGQTVDRLVGWQARLIEDAPEAIPKYLTMAGMRKSAVLYGLPVATRCPGPLVVVEGVVDAWRAGPTAVALFGKTMSSEQCRLLAHHGRGRAVIVVLDSDAQPEATRVLQQIAAARAALGDPSPTTLGQLPSHRKDPGECIPTEMAELLGRAVGTRMNDEDWD